VVKVIDKAKILNEVINAKIVDIMVPGDCTYNWERLVESSRVNSSPVTIVLDNGERLLLYGMMRLDDE